MTDASSITPAAKAPPRPPHRPEIARTIADLRRQVRAWRRAGETVAMVPTMGAVHEGHLSLVEQGFQRADHVVVSIFVNPTQFAPTEDFQNYPRTEERDLDLLATLATDLVFAPSPREMYQSGFATRIEPQGAALGLEADSRPHFFGGMATVVAKLLLACLPDVAVFGEKDYQQLLVVRQIVRDLNIPTEILGAPTIREPDGLALSSRNAFLSPAQRAAAPALFAAMNEVASMVRDGAAIDLALAEGARRIAKAGFHKLDYLALRDADALAPPKTGDAAPLRLLAAAWIGETRLIDNIAV